MTDLIETYCNFISRFDKKNRYPERFRFEHGSGTKSRQNYQNENKKLFLVRTFRQKNLRKTFDFLNAFFGSNPAEKYN